MMASCLCIGPLLGLSQQATVSCTTVVGLGFSLEYIPDCMSRMWNDNLCHVLSIKASHVLQSTAIFHIYMCSYFYRTSGYTVHCRKGHYRMLFFSAWRLYRLFYCITVFNLTKPATYALCLLSFYVSCICYSIKRFSPIIVFPPKFFFIQYLF